MLVFVGQPPEFSEGDIWMSKRCCRRKHDGKRILCPKRVVNRMRRDCIIFCLMHTGKREIIAAVWGDQMIGDADAREHSPDGRINEGINSLRRVIECRNGRKDDGARLSSEAHQSQMAGMQWRFPDG